jgi:hypothetical protein
VQQVTSSIVFSSGSNNFGNQLSNNQTFTGSVNITGSLALAGNITSNGTAVVLGSGTTNYLPKFTGASTIGNSLVFDNGTNVGVNTASPNDYIDGESGMAILRATNGRAVLSLVGTRTDAGETLGRISFTNTNSTNAGSKRLAYISGTRGTTNNSAYLEFAVANDALGSVAMTLSQTGNLGLGVTPSAWGTSSIKALQVGTFGSLAWTGGVDVNIFNNAYYDGTNFKYIASQEAARYLINRNSHTWFIAPAGTADNNITFTPAMTITSGGQVGIGSSTIAASSGYKMLKINGTTGGEFVLSANDVDCGYMYASAGIFVIDAVGNYPLRFRTNAGNRMDITAGGEVQINNNVGNGVVGTNFRVYGYSGNSFFRLGNNTSNSLNIQLTRSDSASMFSVDGHSGAGFLNSSAWSYGSDRRIKENINYIETGLDKVLALKPATFDYIEGLKNNVGWIAQDVQEVIPEAVSVISEDNDQLTLKSDFILPYLVKAIQELKAELDELKNK